MLRYLDRTHASNRAGDIPAKKGGRLGPVTCSETRGRFATPKGNPMSKGSNAAQNNRANQMNPNNPASQGSRVGGGHSKPALDNRSVQLNAHQPAPTLGKPAPESPAAAQTTEPSKG